MRYYQDAVIDIEDLLMDFLVYRKNKRPLSYSIQSEYEAGKGWPHYKDMEFLPLNWDVEKMKGAPKPERDVMPQQLQMPEPGMLSIDSPVLPEPQSYGVQQKDLADGGLEDLKHLLGDINSHVEPFVRKNIDDYHYQDSPIFHDGISADFIKHLIDTTLWLAKESPEIAKIMAEEEASGWNVNQLLRAVIESLILYELSSRRRQANFRTASKNWDDPAYI